MQADSGQGAELPHTISFQNAWVASVDAGTRRMPGWAALAIAVAALAASTFGGSALYRALPEPSRLGLGDYAALALDRLAQDVCIVGPLLIVAWVLIHSVERRPRAAPTIAALPAAAIGAGAGTALFLAALAAAAACGAVQVGADHSGLAHRLLGVVVGALLILFQAGSEEVFFRGWLQPVLAARWGPWVGLLATSALFAAAHALVQPLGLVASLNDLLAGAAFGLLALRTGALWAPTAAHWGWNWAEQSLAGATPNPGVDPLGSLFDFDLKGPALLSGGVDEMNGSLCATLALAALIACAAMLKPRRRCEPA